MAEARIDYERREGLAFLTLHQPGKLNAVSHDMWRSVPELVKRAGEDASVRAIVVQGAGDKAFSSGADISQFEDRRADPGAALLYDFDVRNALRALSSGEKPTVALIRGLCYGGGLAIALSCDLRLAADNARFCIPAARLGLGYDYHGVESMTRRLSLGAIADILYSARTFDAAEALRLGVLTHLWSVEAFEAESAAYLARIAGNAPLTLKAVALSLRELQKPEAERNADAAHIAVAHCFASEDYAEGRRAFAEKRAPAFRGR